MFKLFFSNINIETFIFLSIFCFIASFIDAIVGGGGLISIPAYLASGLPIHIALGTNKLSSCTSTTASSFKFIFSGKVNKELIYKLFLFSFIGSFIGVKTVILINPKYLSPLIIILLTLIFLYSLINKNLGEENKFKELNKKNILISRVIFFIIGFYDGFLGPGSGSFMIFALIKIFKLDFTSACANAKLLGLSSNVASMLSFIILKKVNFFYSIPIGIIMIFGAILGTKFALIKGNIFIKPLFLIITFIILIKMLLETIFYIDIIEIIKNLISIIIF